MGTANPAEQSHAERLRSAYLALGTLKAGSGQMTEANAAFQPAADRYDDTFTKPQYASTHFRWGKSYIKLMGLSENDPRMRFAETE